MTALGKIKKAIRLLDEAGEKALVSDLLCAFAALTDSDMPRVDLTYSSIMRNLRANHKDVVEDFQKIFKSAFEEALDNDVENPEKVALLQAIQLIDVEF